MPILTFNMRGKSVGTAVWDFAAKEHVDVVALQESYRIATDGRWVVAPSGKVTGVFASSPPVGVTAETGSITYTPAGGAGVELKTRAGEAGAGKRFAYVHVNWADPSGSASSRRTSTRRARTSRPPRSRRERR